MEYSPLEIREAEAVWLGKTVESIGSAVCWTLSSSFFIFASNSSPECAWFALHSHNYYV